MQVADDGLKYELVPKVTGPVLGLRVNLYCNWDESIWNRSVETTQNELGHNIEARLFMVSSTFKIK